LDSYHLDTGRFTWARMWGSVVIFWKQKGPQGKKFGKHWSRRLGGTQSCPGHFPEENSPATSKNRTTISWASSQ